MLNEDSPNPSADSAEDFTVQDTEKLVAQPLNIGLTLAFCAAGLVIPGLGHVLLRRWVRGLILSACVLLMFVSGLGMHGELYLFTSVEDLLMQPFHILGIFANIGVGLPYFVATRAEWGEGVMTSQTFDYGWAYLVVAGLLNYLIVLDAFDIAKGRKP